MVIVGEAMCSADILVEDDRWTLVLSEAFVRRCCDATRDHEAALAGDVSFLLADGTKIAALNAQFRKQDKPTNVLSFPSGERAPNFLGDVALSYETCRDEAELAGISMADHAAHLIVHGLLHLVGYDHQTDDDAEKMEMIEVQVLAQMGIKNPYGDT